MTADRARHILNRTAGYDKYSLHEAGRLVEGLTVLLRAVHSMPCRVRHLKPVRRHGTNGTHL